MYPCCFERDLYGHVAFLTRCISRCEIHKMAAKRYELVKLALLSLCKPVGTSPVFVPLARSVSKASSSGVSWMGGPPRSCIKCPLLWSRRITVFWDVIPCSLVRSVPTFRKDLLLPSSGEIRLAARRFIICFISFATVGQLGPLS
jgi:hypothetical protein